MNDSSAFQMGQAMGAIAGMAIGVLVVANMGFSVVAIILAFIKRTRGWIITACITGGISLLLVIGGAVGGFYFAQKVAKEAATMIEMKSADGSVAVDVPGNWKNLDNLNPTASIKTGNLLREEYAIVLSEPKGDSGVGAEEYAKILLKQMSGKMTGAKLGVVHKVSLHGSDGGRVRLEGTVNKISVVYLITTLDDGKKLHQLLTWTLASKETTALPVLTRVADSFRLVKTEATSKVDHSPPAQ